MSVTIKISQEIRREAYVKIKVMTNRAENRKNLKEGRKRR